MSSVKKVVKKVIKAGKTVAPYSNLFTAPYKIGDYIANIGKKLREQKNKKNAAAAEVAASQAAMARSSEELMGMATAENLSPEEQAKIDQYKQGQQANLRSALAAMGISKGTGALAGERAIESGAVAMDENVRFGYWAQAMRLQGMSEASLDFMTKQNDADKQSRIATFNTLLTSVGAGVSIGTNWNRMMESRED